MWSEFVDVVLGAFTAALTFLHDVVASVPFLAPAAWGWAIVLLTLVVRVLMLPLAIKQTRSMRAMQKLQPQIKELQKKHKVDRSLMKKDPEQYKAKRQKLNEEMMALYQREGANPAASCLPLLAQAPIFIALFWTLREAGLEGGPLAGAEFYFFTAGSGGLEQIVRGAGWPGWLLIVLMSGTMFWSMRQMQAKTPTQMEGAMAQQQKVMLYVMPVFLAVVSINFPMGVLLYWVTTNFWQVAQQAIILREVQHEAEAEEEARKREAPGAPKGPSKGATSGKQKPRQDDADDAPRTPDEATPDEAPAGGAEDRPAKRERRPGDANGRRQPRGDDTGNGDGQKDAPKPRPKKRDHLPRRGDRR